MNYKKLAGAGIAAIGFIMFALLIWPLFKGIGEIKEAVESKQAFLDQRKGVLDKVSSLKRTVAAKKADIDELAVVLPADKKTQEIIVNVEEIARESGLAIRELKTAKVLSQDKNPANQTLQVEISGSGFYKSVLELLKGLEKNLRIFDVQEFTVSLDSAGEATGLLNVDLKLHTYYLNDAVSTK